MSYYSKMLTTVFLITLIFLSSVSGITQTVNSGLTVRYKTNGYFSFGGGFPVTAGSQKYEPFNNFNFELYHSVLIQLKGGVTIFRSKGSNPDGLFLNAGLGISRSGSMNANFGRSFSSGTRTTFVIIESTGSILIAGIDLSAGYTIPFKGNFALSPYVGINPGLLRLSTNGDKFTDIVEEDAELNRYIVRSNTTVKSQSFNISPEVGLVFNFGNLMIRTSLFLLSTDLKLQISSIDFQGLDAGVKEYSHNVKFSSNPFVIALGVRF